MQGVAEHAESERRLGRDVDDVGTKAVDRALHRAERRQGKEKFLVKRKRPRPHQMRLDARGTGSTVVRMNEQNVVAVIFQAAYELPQRARNAVDLGQVCFRDETNSHLKDLASPVVWLRASLLSVPRGRGSEREDLMSRGAVDSRARCRRDPLSGRVIPGKIDHGRRAAWLGRSSGAVTGNAREDR